jgi:hypothetical protein
MLNVTSAGQRVICSTERRQTGTSLPNVLSVRASGIHQYTSKRTIWMLSNGMSVATQRSNRSKIPLGASSHLASDQAFESPATSPFACGLAGHVLPSTRTSPAPLGLAACRASFHPSPVDLSFDTIDVLIQQFHTRSFPIRHGRIARAVLHPYLLRSGRLVV